MHLFNYVYMKVSTYVLCSIYFKNMKYFIYLNTPSAFVNIFQCCKNNNTYMIDQGRNNLSAGLTTAYTLKSHFRVETC